LDLSQKFLDHHELLNHLLLTDLRVVILASSFSPHSYETPNIPVLHII